MDCISLPNGKLHPLMVNYQVMWNLKLHKIAANRLSTCCGLCSQIRMLMDWLSWWLKCQQKLLYGIWNWFVSQSPELKSFQRWPSCFRAPCGVRWLGEQATMWQSWALAVADFLLMRCSMFSICKLLSKYRTVIWKRRVSIGHLCLKGSMLWKNQVRSPESVLDMTVWLDWVWSLATWDHQMIISICITEPATTSERLLHVHIYGSPEFYLSQLL